MARTAVTVGRPKIYGPFPLPSPPLFFLDNFPQMHFFLSTVGLCPLVSVAQLSAGVSSSAPSSSQKNVGCTLWNKQSLQHPPSAVTQPPWLRVIWHEPSSHKCMRSELPSRWWESGWKERQCLNGWWWGGCARTCTTPNFPPLFSACFTSFLSFWHLLPLMPQTDTWSLECSNMQTRERTEGVNRSTGCCCHPGPWQCTEFAFAFLAFLTHHAGSLTCTAGETKSLSQRAHNPLPKKSQERKQKKRGRLRKNMCLLQAFTINMSRMKQYI